MSFETVRVSLDSYLKDNFGSDYQILPENFPFTPPSGIPWVRYSIRPVTSLNADVSGIFRRRNYLLWFQIFVPEDTGTVSANKIADLIASLFDNHTIISTDGTMIFQRAELTFIGPDTTGWQLFRCTVAFRDDSGA